jgi:PAS domain S-box-containing protein
MSMDQHDNWRILYIEDDQDDYYIVRHMLNGAANRKIDLDWAEDYEEGRSKILSEKYDAILVDYNLGNHSGIEIIQEFYNQSSAPFILYTSHNSHEFDREAQKAGATLFLTKQDANPLLLERIIRYAIERKQKEELAQHASDKYQALFNSIDQGFCTIEVKFDENRKPLDYRFLEVSPSFEHQTGIKDGLGRWMRDIAPDQDEYWFEVYGQVALTGESARFEYLSTPLGRWWNVYAFRVEDPELRRVGVLFNDITRRKHDEEAMRQNAERKAFLLQLNDSLRIVSYPQEIKNLACTLLGQRLHASRVHYTEIKPDGVTSVVETNYVNGATAISGVFNMQDFGLMVYESLHAGKTLVQGNLPADTGYSEAERAAYASIGVAAQVVVPLLKNGRLQAALVVHNCAPKNWTEDEIILVEETAERTWAAVERSRAEEALRESEQRFRAMADGTPVIIWVTDQIGRVEFVNRAYTDYFSVSIEKVKNEGWQPLVHPEDEAGYVNVFIQCLEDQKPFYAQARVQGSHTGWRWIESYAQPRFSETGQFLGMAGSTLDINDRLEAEKELQHYALELERSNRALEDFSSIASHDLQEPLRKIKAFGQLVEKNCYDELQGEAKDYIGRMLSATERMDQMLQGLLEYSRVTSKGRPYTQVNLGKVLEGVLNDLEARIHDTGAHIEVRDLPSIMADELQMRLLLQNLIANALKYHRPGVPPLVKISCENEDHSAVEISIQDNGIGFDTKAARRIFEPFTRIHSKSEYEGHGIGLAICKKIVERHEGEISYSSVPGDGSVFKVRLPV